VLLTGVGASDSMVLLGGSVVGLEVAIVGASVGGTQMVGLCG